MLLINKFIKFYKRIRDQLIIVDYHIIFIKGDILEIVTV